MFKRALDLGGSQSRLGIKKNKIKVEDSVYMEIDKDSQLKPYIKDTFCDFIIERNPLPSLLGRRFVRGEALDHYKGKMFVCDNQSLKVEQESIYVNSTYMLAKDLASNFRNDETLNIGVCIPTSEFYSETKDYATLLKQCMSGEHSVYFPLEDKRVKFTLTPQSILVFPEGVVAAYKFKNNVNFRKSVTLIVDIGYRSSDITPMKNFKPVGKAAVSRPKGGINIEATLLGELERANIFKSREEIKDALCSSYILREDTLIDITTEIEDAQIISEEDWKQKVVDAMHFAGTEVTIDEVTTAYRNHYIMQGRTPKCITEQVTTAKRNFASSLKGDIVDVLSTQMMNISSVNNLLPIGRPFKGELDDPNNLINLLCAELGSNLEVYQVPNLGTANVEEIMGVLLRDEARV